MADELGIKLKASLGDYRELIKGISNLEKEIKPIKIKLDLGNARELVDILKKATPENRSCLHNCTLLGQKGLVKPLLEPQ